MESVSRGLKREIDKFASVTTLLDKLGCKYEIDFTSIRGFEYYTGICFKIRAAGSKICSGGRYDNLVKLVGGTDAPACGFALYIDDLAPMVRSWSQQKAEKTVLITAEKKDVSSIKKAFDLAGSLRSAGLIAEFAFSGSQLNSRWEVTVNARTAGYTVLDAVSQTRKKAASANEVISIIGGFKKGGR
jgi:histidyl-tRNA synthetase